MHTRHYKDLPDSSTLTVTSPRKSAPPLREFHLVVVASVYRQLVESCRRVHVGQLHFRFRIIYFVHHGPVHPTLLVSLVKPVDVKSTAVVGNVR